MDQPQVCGDGAAEKHDGAAKAGTERVAKRIVRSLVLD